MSGTDRFQQLHTQSIEDTGIFIAHPLCKLWLLCHTACSLEITDALMVFAPHVYKLGPYASIAIKLQTPRGLQ